MFLKHILATFCLITYASAYKAQGNLAVVIKPEEDRLFSTDEDPLTAQTSDLWCQASDSNDIQNLNYARFVRTHDRKIFDATLDGDKKRARLVFGRTPVNNAGKYRCEMRTEDGELLYGNMFVNTRPYVYSNGSLDLEMDKSDPTLVVTKTVQKLTAGEAGTLTCPVKGYPHVEITWYKDGNILEESENILIDKETVEFTTVSPTDAGLYRCEGKNQFSHVVDAQPQSFEVKFEQQVQMAGSYDWVLPLIIILIIFLLLFIIIYSCQACKRYKAAQYNVNERERRQGRTAEETRALKADAV